MKKLDLTGQRYGRLLVISEAKSYISPSGKTKKARWNCACDCGNQFVALASHIRSGNTQSCGCLQKEKAREMFTTHGKRQDPIYRIYHHMIARCLNPKDPHYRDYGGRGITVCDRWLESFENFYKDMGDRPDGLTLDRINNDSNYEPSNCKWSTHTQQAINQRMQKNNTSGVTGVYWHKDCQKWQASIKIDNKNIHLGYFTNKEDAIAARKEAEQKYHKPILEN